MKFFFFLFLLLPLQVLAQGQVLEIISPHEVTADAVEQEKFQKGEKVIIISRQEDRLVAFGTIEKLDFSQGPSHALISINELVDNSLVMTGDLIYPLEFSLMEEKKVPGFFSLTLRGDNKIPSQYKELAYFGLFTSDGHVLDKKEWLLSPFEIQYGVTNNFGVKIVNALWLDDYVNAGFKYQIMRNKYGKLSMNTLGGYKVHDRDWIWQVGGLLTLPSNAKYQTHFSARFTFDPQYEGAKATKDLNLFRDSDIRNIYEYITDSWNRILLGPVYNVELQTFGGTVSYMWIWDSFHMSLGMATRDFTKLKVGKEGYYYVYDFFWRF